MELWERAATLDRLERALRGPGRVALVSGEAGIGKSAVVRELAERCAGRATVLWGWCDPLVTPRASGPLHDVARQVGGELAATVDTDPLGALVAELDRSPRRTVLVVEDAHWADEATLDLLVFLGRRIERLPATLVVTYRDDEVGPDHPLRAALAALPRHVLLDVPVEPLSPECVAEHGGAGLHELTGGNPLLVTELLAAGPDAVPPTVTDLVLARLGRLPAPARAVAQLVAVIPSRAELAVLPPAVDDCVAGGVLLVRGDAVAYRHELLRRAVEDSLPPARRAALHREALRLLAAYGADPARLVHHARAAGDVAALLKHGRVAARQAAALGAHREAVAHGAALLPYADRLPAAERAELLEGYAVQTYLAGVPADGVDALTRAVALRRSLGEPVRAGDDLRWLSRLAWWSGHAERARAAAAEAVETLAAAGAGRELAMAYSTLSQLHMLAWELADAVEWGARARELADRLGDLDTSLHAAVNVGTARLLQGDPAAAADLAATHAAAAAAGLVDTAARALVNRAATLLDNADVGAGAAAVDEAMRYAAAHDLDGYLQYLLGLRACVRLERCEWDAALADAADALSRPGRSGGAVVPALVARGRILTARGDPAALSTLDRAAAEAGRTGELQRLGPVAAARAEHFLLAGEPERAAAELGPALRPAVAAGHRWLAGELAYRRWQATGQPLEVDGTPHRLVVDGDAAGAARAWTERGRRYAAIEALGYGDREHAAAALRTLDELGATAAAARVRAELRRRGVPVPRGPRPATAANAAGLTARQLEVLTLHAAGASTPDIAARLTLSPRTVEHHVSAVLAKLDVPTRAQAVATAHRLRILAPPT